MAAVFGEQGEEALQIIHKRQLQGGFCLEGLTLRTPTGGQLICKVAFPHTSAEQRCVASIGNAALAMQESQSCSF